MYSFEGKTVLVTGATGLIGSHIVDELMKSDNVNVIALSRSKAKLETGFSMYMDKPNFSVIAKDISGLSEIDTKIDIIFHAAGPMEGKIIREYPVDVINPNIVGTVNCLNLLKKQKEDLKVDGRLILFSSVTVYGNCTDKDYVAVESDTRVTENLDSVSAPYSQSKRMSEVIALAYARQFNLDIVIARFSTVYGSTRFIPDTAFFEFIKKGIRSEDITLNMSGLPRRDNIYIDDAVKGVLTIASEGINLEAYNVSSNGDLDNYASVDEIAQIIAAVSNKDRDNKIQVLFKNENTGERKPGLKLDNSKLKGLGWDITVSMEEGIQKTLEDISKREF